MMKPIPKDYFSIAMTVCTAVFTGYRRSNQSKIISIVGTRNYGHLYGKQVCEELVNGRRIPALDRKRTCIRCIDTIAHKAALKINGNGSRCTWARIVYTRNRIKWSQTDSWKRWHTLLILQRVMNPEAEFPKRNRISLYLRCDVVIESAVKVRIHYYYRTGRQSWQQRCFAIPAEQLIKSEGCKLSHKIKTRASPVITGAWSGFEMMNWNTAPSNPAY